MFSPASSSTSSRTVDTTTAAMATPGERTELPDMLVAWPQDPHGAWSYCVSIPSYQSENDVVFYAVEVAVQSPFGTTSVKRQVPQRYTAFRTLHAALKALPEDQLPKASKASIPVPPPKTIGKKKDEAALNERRSALSEWLQRTLSDVHVSRTQPVLSFLELPRAARRAVAAVLQWNIGGNESDLDEAAKSADIPEHILKRADGSTKFHDKTVALLAYAADVEAQLEEQDRRNRSERNDSGVSQAASSELWDKPVLIESIQPSQQTADLLSGPPMDLMDGLALAPPTASTTVENNASTQPTMDLLGTDGPAKSNMGLPSGGGLPSGAGGYSPGGLPSGAGEYSPGGFPSDALSSGVGGYSSGGFPSDGLPSGGSFPSNAMPSDGLPSSSMPSDALPAGGAPEDDVDRAANAAALAAGLRVSRRSELRRMCEGLERKLSAAVGDIALMAEALGASQQKRLELEAQLREYVPRIQIQSLEAANVALSEELRRRDQLGSPESPAVQAEKQQLMNQIAALSAETQTLRQEKESELAKKKVLAKELKSLMKASKANEEKEKQMLAQNETTTTIMREAMDLRNRIETAASVNMAMEAEGEAGMSSTACLHLLESSDERIRALQAEIDLTFSNDGNELRNSFALILRDMARLYKTVNSLLRGTMHVDSTSQTAQLNDATRKLWHALR